jgi:predicted nucleotidyltransferase
MCRKDIIQSSTGAKVSGMKEKILQEIKQTITKIVPNSKMFLFGSRARNEAKKYSDWDILILIDNNSKIRDLEEQIINNLYEIELKYSIAISILVYEENLWNEKYSLTELYENINNEGVMI